MTDQPVAGWYPDPELPDQLRWWDGTTWTDARRPVAEPPTTGADPTLIAGPATEAAAEAGGGPGGTGGLNNPPPPWQAGADTPGAPPQVGGGATPGGPAPGAAPPPGADVPPPKRSAKPWLLAGGGVVVVAAVVLVLVFVVFSSDKPSFTWNGHEIDEPAKTLEAAQTNFRRVAKDRKGATNDNSRCYFAKAAKPADGDNKTDVGEDVFCGPVLFVDGSTKAPWLRFRLQDRTDGDKVALRPTSGPVDDDPAPLPSTVKLERPDGKTAPEGAGGLRVPLPPPAEAGAFHAVSYPSGETDDSHIDVPAIDKPILVQSWSEGVSIDAYGLVKRFGEGDEARSAAKGQKLVAARLSHLGGLSLSAVGDSKLSVSDAKILVVVDGDTDRAHEVEGITTRDDVDLVVSVPQSSKQVELWVQDAGATQKVSLLTGKGAAGNPDVLGRSNLVKQGGPSGVATITFTKPGYQPQVAKVTLKVTKARLTWWGGKNADQHPTSTSKAFLRLAIDYTWQGDASGAVPAEQFTLKLPDGSVVKGRDLDPSADHVWVVFEVPASFTSGTAVVSGSAMTPSGLTATATVGVNLPITIPTS